MVHYVRNEINASEALAPSHLVYKILETLNIACCIRSVKYLTKY